QEPGTNRKFTHHRKFLYFRVFRRKQYVPIVYLRREMVVQRASGYRSDAIQTVVNMYSGSKAHAEATMMSGRVQPQSEFHRLACSLHYSRQIFWRQDMNTPTIVLIALFFSGVLVSIIVGIWLYFSSRRTKQLRAKFGPEYRRVARTEGDAKRAEHVLQEREQRVNKLDIKPLTDQQRNNFADAWEHAQAECVD